MVIGYPRAAQTNARDVPVLPPVYSTTVPEGRSRPDAACRVLALDFHEYAGGSLRNEPLQFHQGCFADGIEDVGSFCHAVYLEVARNSSAVPCILFAERASQVLFLDQDQQVHV